MRLRGFCLLLLLSSCGGDDPELRAGPADASLDSFIDAEKDVPRGLFDGGVLDAEQTRDSSPGEDAAIPMVLEENFNRLIETAHARESRLLNPRHMSAELLANIYYVRALSAGVSLPEGVRVETFLDKAFELADVLVESYYREDCFEGARCTTIGGIPMAPRFLSLLTLDPDHQETDVTVNVAISMAELTLLLLELDPVVFEESALRFYQTAVRVAVGANKRFRFEEPLQSGEMCPGYSQSTYGIKWNISNRFAALNYLVYLVRERFNDFPARIGDPNIYRDAALSAAACFRDDLRTAPAYQCADGPCIDGDWGPFWGGWHSGTARHSRIPDDASHAAASMWVVFYSARYNMGVFTPTELSAFRRGFFRRRKVDPDGADLFAFMRTWETDSLVFVESCVPYPAGPVDRCARLDDNPTAIASYSALLSVLPDTTDSDWRSYNTAPWPRSGDAYNVNHPLRTHYLSGAFELFDRVGAPYSVRQARMDP